MVLYINALFQLTRSGQPLHVWSTRTGRCTLVAQAVLNSYIMISTLHYLVGLVIITGLVVWITHLYSKIRDLRRQIKTLEGPHEQPERRRRPCFKLEQYLEFLNRVHQASKSDVSVTLAVTRALKDLLAKIGVAFSVEHEAHYRIEHYQDAIERLHRESEMRQQRLDRLGDNHQLGTPQSLSALDSKLKLAELERKTWDFRKGLAGVRFALNLWNGKEPVRGTEPPVSPTVN